MNYDVKHRQNIARYARQMDDAFKSVADQCSNFANQKYPSAFRFDHPSVKEKADKIFFSFGTNLEGIIKDGITNEWGLSNEKNNALVNSYLKNIQSLKNADRFLQPNLDALEAFVNREVKGMNLSKRVWNIADQFKNELEVHVGLGIANGDSSATISRRTRQYLKNPDALFRRVRDEKGNLRLSKRAQDYNPGQGVYRSACMNGYRLTASETNMSYREADYTRWQQLDFVVGIRIQISDQHFARMPQGDICDRVQGVYPKNYKFTGWHPLCLCRATAIMLSDDEYDEFEDALLEGRRYNPKKSVNFVGDVPDEFKSWIIQNKDRIKGWQSKPYFVRDNFKYGNIEKGLKFQTVQKVNSSSSIVGGIIKGPVNNTNDINAILNSYSQLFPKDFARGFRAVTEVSDSKFMMATNSVGDILVSNVTDMGFNPRKELVDAFQKIKAGKKLTFNNEYAVESLYHEILHNKAIKYEALPPIDFGYQRASMEVVNQFVARNDYPQFIERLGGKSYHQAKVLSEGLGYQHWIDNFRYLTGKLKLDEKDLLPKLRTILFEKKYSEIDKNLIELLSKESGVAKIRIKEVVHSLTERSSEFKNISLVWLELR